VVDDPAVLISRNANNDSSILRRGVLYGSFDYPDCLQEHAMLWIDQGAFGCRNIESIRVKSVDMT
jgi:hypothetical protein